MNNKYLIRLRNLILNELKDEPVQIVLFGSRAREDHQTTSDVDVGIIPSHPINEKKISVLREKIEGLNIPYQVELVNLDQVSESFRKEILKDAIFWK